MQLDLIGHQHVIALAMLLSGIAPSSAQTPARLAPPTEYAVQDEPSAIAVGDINGDRVADLVVANFRTFSISVLLGNASGEFAEATHIPTLPSTGQVPTSVALGDLNADSFVDLVVGAGYMGLNNTGVKVLLGDGTGGFGTPTNFRAGNDPWSVVIGEFTGDAIPDVAAARRLGGVSIIAGRGDGTFEAPVFHATGEFSESIAAGDLNGDGALDLVTANSTSNDISILIAGGGSFAPAVNIPVGPTPYRVVIADLNVDGDLDLVLTDQIERNVRVFLNDGAATFTPLDPIPAGEGATALDVGDLNNDGIPDIAVGNYFGNTVDVYAGDGQGNFQSTDSFEARNPSFVAVGRFGGGSWLGLVHANEGADNIVVRLNTAFIPGFVFRDGFEPR